MYLVATILVYINECAVRCSLLRLPPCLLSTYSDCVVMTTLRFALNVQPISGQFQSNQSIDLHCKSADRFLFEWNINQGIYESRKQTKPNSDLVFWNGLLYDWGNASVFHWSRQTSGYVMEISSFLESRL